MRRFLVPYVLVALVMTAHLPFNAHALTVYCTNCSNKFVQALERATSVSQLATLMDQYSEDVMQTEQQVMMVKQNIEQIAYMLKNTKSLNRYTLRGLKNRFMRLGRLVGRVSRHKGEVNVLEDVYRTHYPSYGQVEGMVGKGSATANAEYQQRWRKWSEQVDAASMATFKLSGQQLSEIANSEEFDEHVQKLLNDPQGRMEAVQAANQLSALQIEETRALRALLATSIQEQTQQTSKQEKVEQTSREQWRKAFDSKTLDGVSMETMRPGPPNTF